MYLVPNAPFARTTILSFCVYHPGAKIPVRIPSHSKQENSEKILLPGIFTFVSKQNEILNEILSGSGNRRNPNFCYKASEGRGVCRLAYAESLDTTTAASPARGCQVKLRSTASKVEYAARAHCNLVLAATVAATPGSTRSASRGAKNPATRCAKTC